MDVMKPNPGRVCSLQWNAALRGEPWTEVVRVRARARMSLRKYYAARTTEPNDAAGFYRNVVLRRGARQFIIIAFRFDFLKKIFMRGANISRGPGSRPADRRR